MIRIGEQRVAIAIGDVMGKGIGAALLMSNLQATVRVLAPQVSEPCELCNRINRIVAANNIPGMFITFAYCVVDLEAMRITYTNAGHNWPILARRTGKSERLCTKDTVLGTMPHWNYHQQELSLRNGDRLVLFTDGITECTNRAGIEFGEEHLVGLVSRHIHRAPDELKNLILTSAISHSGDKLSDDATVMVAAVG